MAFCAVGPGRPAGAISGRAMRIATHLWLGVPAVPWTAAARRCACRAAVDAFGYHFLAACCAPSYISKAMFRHMALVARTAEALRAHPQSRDVVVETFSAFFSAVTSTLRRDVRVVHVQTGGVVWGDVAFASVFPEKVVAGFVVRPSLAVAAVAREARTVPQYAPRRPVADPAAVFTPLV